MSDLFVQFSSLHVLFDAVLSKMNGSLSRKDKLISYVTSLWPNIQHSFAIVDIVISKLKLFCLTPKTLQHIACKFC